MAQGKRAESLGHRGREYWSRRVIGMFSWGRVGKWLTHRAERRCTTGALEMRARLKAEGCRLQGKRVVVVEDEGTE